MRNALSIAAGASSETSVPKKLLMTRLKLISPRLIVTGSISSSTRLTSGLMGRGKRQIIRKRAAPNLVCAQVPGGDRELDHGADQHPDRVRVDLVLLGELRRERRPARR